MITIDRPFTQITSLNLSGKGLLEIPKEVFECTNLRKLNLSSNEISRIPLNIQKLRKLEVLDIANNKLSQLQSGIFKLKKLKRLVLANNDIKSIPTQISNLLELEVLMLQNNKIKNLNNGNITNRIRKLNLSNNSIEDIKWLFTFYNLKQLWIGGNNIGKLEYNLLSRKIPKCKVYYKVKSDFVNIPAQEFKQAEDMGNSIIPNTIEVVNDKAPIVCISYTWDDEPHKEWVLNLSKMLRENGIETLLDRYHLRPGNDKNKFMEDMIARSQRALIILTPNYKNKADNRIGGAGYEYSLITSEVFKKQGSSKFIPILRRGNIEESSPRTLESKIAIFMRDEDNFEEQLEALCREIHNEPKVKVPKIGPKPQYL